jgi:hypothetical protein
MVTSVKILSLEVRFGVRNDVKMVPTFLKCFPNLERLHIKVLFIHLVLTLLLVHISASLMHRINYYPRSFYCVYGQFGLSTLL